MGDVVQDCTIQYGNVQNYVDPDFPVISLQLQ
jgi:hypothetical protein